MRRAADLLAAVHAVAELAALWIILAGDLATATAIVVGVALPMWLFGGSCWLTMLERNLRGQRVPSMTRRLLMAVGVSRADSRWAQWIVLGGAAAWWLVRVLG